MSELQKKALDKGRTRMASTKLVGLLNAQATATAIGVASRTGLLSSLGSKPSTAVEIASRAGVALRQANVVFFLLSNRFQGFKPWDIFSGIQKRSLLFSSPARSSNFCPLQKIWS